ncbi:methylated-DNA--[protein]-cysteine S-methyltransferase [Marinobacter nauticus]
MICYSMGSCALGQLLVAWSDRGICAVGLADTPDQLILSLQADFADHSLHNIDAASSPYFSTVHRFIEVPSASPPDLPLDLMGTAFQQRVWRALMEIPPGHTVTYSGLAQKIGNPSAVRAVANACGANRIATLVPCHRVVRSDGAIGGYRWGSARKQTLLAREDTIPHH